ncbi:glycoprotein G2 [Bovine nidovirus TCH5]|uniref:Glycoprotein G2 n=1 Tax=Bovine nidovirus TCH5 TaxID=1631554 RepID=A0A0F6PMZ4_9NIDO|nr:glycoprotein G2 [Bovine nidovirus TCH5]AJW66855.1 glycoprotein G2 [Bovine nidovirus TCH5]
MLGMRLIGGLCLFWPKRLRMLSYKEQGHCQLVKILLIIMCSFSLEVLSYQGPLVPVASQRLEGCDDRPYVIYCAGQFYMKCDEFVNGIDAKNKTLVCLENIPFLVGQGKLLNLIDNVESELREKQVTLEHYVEIDSNGASYDGYSFHYALVNMPWRGDDSDYPAYWCELVNDTYKVGVFDAYIQHGCVMNVTDRGGVDAYRFAVFIPHHYVFAIMDTYRGQIKWVKQKPSLRVGDVCINSNCTSADHQTASGSYLHWTFDQLKSRYVTIFNKTILPEGSYLEVPEGIFSPMGFSERFVQHNGTYYFKYNGRFIVKGNCMLPDWFKYYTEYNEIVVGKLKSNYSIAQVYFNKTDCKFYNVNFKDVVEYDGRLFFNRNGSLYQRVGNLEFPFGRFNDSVASSGEYLVIPRKSEDYVEVILFGKPKEKESKWLIGVVLACFVCVLLLSWFCQRRTHYA